MDEEEFPPLAFTRSRVALRTPLTFQNPIESHAGAGVGFSTAKFRRGKNSPPLLPSHPGERNLTKNTSSPNTSPCTYPFASRKSSLIVFFFLLLLSFSHEEKRRSIRLPPPSPPDFGPGSEYIFRFRRHRLARRAENKFFTPRPSRTRARARSSLF